MPDNCRCLEMCEYIHTYTLYYSVIRTTSPLAPSRFFHASTLAPKQAPSIGLTAIAKEYIDIQHWFINAQSLYKNVM